MTDRLRVVWGRILEMARTPMNDQTSWVAHWVVVAASTGAIAGIMQGATGHGILTGLLVSEAWAFYFLAIREPRDLLKHQAAGDDMDRWITDGRRDKYGPLLHHLIWWAVFLAT